jgi:hypothetical protein
MLGPSANQQECLQLVRNLWRKDLIDGISSQRRREADAERIKSALAAGTFCSLEELDVQADTEAPMRSIVANLAKELGDGGLDQLEVKLNADPTGGCPCIRILTAFEAEMLWDWINSEGERTSNPERANEKWGRSKMQDISHLSTYLPYVDALTTDNNMASFRQRPMVADELRRYPVKVFSSRTYDEFLAWLGDIDLPP